MSHDTGHGHSTENKTIISFKNSFWLVIILVGLFVAALNFINAESGHEEHEGHQTTEAHGTAPAHGEKAHEATEHSTEAAAPHAEEAPAADSAAHH